MFCENCKKENGEDAKFCLYCGTRLNLGSSKNNNGSVDKYFSSKRDLYINEAKKLANKEMITGTVWLGGAIAITLGGYLFSPAGGTYYVLWGAMIYGGYRFFRGLGYKLNPESLLQKAEDKSKEEGKK